MMAHFLFKLCVSISSYIFFDVVCSAFLTSQAGINFKALFFANVCGTLTLAISACVAFNKCQVLHLY